MKYIIAALIVWLALGYLDFEGQAKKYVTLRCIEGRAFWETSPDHSDGPYHGFYPIYDGTGKKRRCVQ